MSGLENAIHRLAKKQYAATVPQAAPSWDEADPMVRHQFLEAIGTLVNWVLEEVSPVAPDVEVLKMHLKLACDELEADSGLMGLVPASVAVRKINNAINESAGGADKEDEDG